MPQEHLNRHLISSRTRAPSLLLTSVPYSCKAPDQADCSQLHQAQVPRHVNASLSGQQVLQMVPDQAISQMQVQKPYVLPGGQSWAEAEVMKRLYEAEIACGSADALMEGERNQDMFHI